MSDFREWLEKPFSTSNNAFQWALALGFVIVVIWMWNSVLLLFVRKTAQVASEVSA